jgi:hypothetical protein
MRKFRVRVQGRNLLIEVDGIRGKYGFYTNVFLEAFTLTEAESAALDLIQQDSRLRESALNPKDDAFLLLVDETEEIETFDGLKLPRTGLILYEE